VQGPALCNSHTLCELCREALAGRGSPHSKGYLSTPAPEEVVEHRHPTLWLPPNVATQRCGCHPTLWLPPNVVVATLAATTRGPEAAALLHTLQLLAGSAPSATHSPGTRSAAQSGPGAPLACPHPAAAQTCGSGGGERWWRCGQRWGDAQTPIFGEG